MIHLTVDDFLDSFDRSDSYSAKSGYHAFEAFSNGDYKSFRELADRFSVSYPTVRQWNQIKPLTGKKPIPSYVRKVEVLQELDLLPLDDSKSLFPFFKELYLYTLFSGNIYQKNNNTYDVNLSNSFDKLELLGKKLRDVFSLDYYIKNRDNANVLLYSSDESGVASALNQLLVAVGCPVGAKKEQVVSIPDFVDVDSLVYYGFKLRGHCNPPPILNTFRLWSSPEDVATRTLDGFKRKLNGLPFNFDFQLFDDNRRVIGDKTPTLKVPVNSRVYLSDFLNNYKSVLPV